MQSNKFKLALICGGPSPERGISLNSARSVMDHIACVGIEIIPLYVDYSKQFYLISTAQLYSNTPDDFDFKLQQTAKPLTREALVKLLNDIDLTFPLVHGAFGEDGELQTLLEAYNIPFVGHSANCCRQIFNKDIASAILNAHSYHTLPQLIIAAEHLNPISEISQFFALHALNRAIVKPAAGGSSIGVYSVASPHEAVVKLNTLFSSQITSRAIVEPFCHGNEFTIVVFANRHNQPVALIPTEIELSYDNHELFDYRKKYLPSHQATYHTPPRFTEMIVDQIRQQAVAIFKLFDMRDFVRLDGWVTNNGDIYFTDINPISGLEQNSFLFRQTSILGMTHREALTYILKRACQRYNLSFPVTTNQLSDEKKPVYVVFGGHNAERQVSLMSGTNVWLKLLQSALYTPTPYFVDHLQNIWQLPYAYCLHHTVEEIYINCMAVHKPIYQTLINNITDELEIRHTAIQQPHFFTLTDFLKHAQNTKAFVFLAMHGGDGENGTWQRYLEMHQIPFNGSDALISSICMDKYATGEKIRHLNNQHIISLPKQKIHYMQLMSYSWQQCQDLWQNCCQILATNALIIKPCSDGCSAGIALLHNAQDLLCYASFVHQKATYIPAHTFTRQSRPIEMPSSHVEYYLLEPFIETDELVIEQSTLYHNKKHGWIELTVGVLEHQGHYHALYPSITVAEGSVLSLEEKFQGGTGINLTPPPIFILSSAMHDIIKYGVTQVAQHLGIKNYARLDIFFNCITQQIILIEVNTLPGLTPSTVIFHQGLAENPPITPLKLLETIIFNATLQHKINI